MAFKKADDYVEVNERIVEFREKYPDGSLQPVDPYKPYAFYPEENPVMIIYGAAAYRTPDDARPGIGYVSEPYPGKTPYTRNSELANAETSAWGRAIVAALAADTKRGIASAVEVRNRKAEQEPGPHVELQQKIVGQLKALKIGPDKAREEFESIGGSGKVSECADVKLLGEFLSRLEAA